MISPLHDGTAHNDDQSEKWETYNKSNIKIAIRNPF